MKVILGNNSICSFYFWLCFLFVITSQFLVSWSTAIKKIKLYTCKGKGTHSLPPACLTTSLNLNQNVCKTNFFLWQPIKSFVRGEHCFIKATFHIYRYTLYFVILFCFYATFFFFCFFVGHHPLLLLHSLPLFSHLERFLFSQYIQSVSVFFYITAGVCHIRQEDSSNSFIILNRVSSVTITLSIYS